MTQPIICTVCGDGSACGTTSRHPDCPFTRAGEPDPSQREFLTAIVAIWMTNNHMPVDGANEPRDLVGHHDWESARVTTDALVELGLLRHPYEAINDATAGTLEFMRTITGSSLDPDCVVPTAAGVFAVLRPLASVE